ncbi:MAG: fused MFS/spermidine synthase [Salibacteraceae bacterium]
MRGLFVKLNLTVFLCGFIVMAFEIIGSRVLAPYVGTSTYVWVSIIGVILLAMSAGYFAGGKWADHKQSISRIANLVLLAGIFIGLMNVGKNTLLVLTVGLPLSLLSKSIISSILLFTLPAFYLAAVFPYALRLRLNDVHDSGRIAGQFYAISTVGSLMGTFLSATILIPLFGTSKILWILSIALVSLGLLLHHKSNKALLILAVAIIGLNGWYVNRTTELIDVDSSYNRIWVYDAISNGEPTRYLAINGHVNSGIWVNDPIEKQLYPYSDYFRLAMHFNPSFSNTLIMGAGGYTFPKLYQHLWPNKQLDIVEIDSKLNEISQQHFFWSIGENTNVIHDDARTYLSATDVHYDIIISDVFTSPIEVPYHMTTLEVYQRQFDLLNDHGVLILNVLGNVEGRHSAFLKSQFKLASMVFPKVLVFEVSDGYDHVLKNNMLIALKSGVNPSLESSDSSIQAMLNHKVEVTNWEDAVELTDEYAPANWLLWN